MVEGPNLGNPPDGRQKETQLLAPLFEDNPCRSRFGCGESVDLPLNMKRVGKDHNNRANKGKNR